MLSYLNRCLLISLFFGGLILVSSCANKADVIELNESTIGTLTIGAVEKPPL